MFSSLVLSVVLFSLCVSSLTQFPVYRFFQLDSDIPAASVSLKLGARSSLFSGSFCSLSSARSILSSSAPTSNSSAPLFLHKVIIVRISELSSADNDLFSFLSRTAEAGASGVLFVLPSSTSSLSSESVSAWRTFEISLAKLALPSSLSAYLAFEDTLPSVFPPEATLSVSGKPLVPLNRAQNPKKRSAAELSLANIRSTLSSASSSSDPLPLIQILAHYDAFAAAPSATFAASESAAPVSVLLELARLFSAASTAGAHPAYDVEFVLASGKVLNYAGARHAASASAATPFFTLCIDSLVGSGKEFSLHVSRPGDKDAATGRVYNALVEGAKLAGLSLSIDQRKVNVAASEFSWPHEALALEHVFSATFSGNNANGGDVPLFARSSVLDREAPSGAVLARVTKGLAEGLARLVYPDVYKTQEGEKEQKTLFQGWLAPNEQRLTLWAESLASVPRCFPTAALANGNTVISLKNALTAAVNNEKEAETSIWKLPATIQMPKAPQNIPEATIAEMTAEAQREVTFYSWPRGVDTEKIQCIVHRKTPALWDLSVVACSVLFLAFLYTAMNGFKKTIQQLTGKDKEKKQ